MYIVRDIFHLKFGHYRDAKALLDEVISNNLMPQNPLGSRILSDFTGDAYRLILEENFNTLAEYEQFMNSGLNADEWQKWYAKFKEHVNSSHREILKQVK